MNREQANSIIRNLELLKHFASGGEIGFRLHDYRGKYVKTYPSIRLNLSGLHEGGTHYVRLKAKLRYDPELGVHVRVQRSRLEPVHEHEIIKD